MRILHISAGNLYGGVEAVLVALARYQSASADFYQEFAVCFESRLSETLAAAGAQVHTLGAVRIRRPVSIWAARRRLRNLLGLKRFDAVVCHMAWPQAIFGPVVRSAGVPLVLWHHDPNGVLHWLDRWARLSLPDLAVCNSRFTAANFRRLHYGIPAEVLYCPVDLPKTGYSTSDRESTRMMTSTPRDATVVLQIGRMEPQKGNLQHLEALARLRDMPGWVCWQVGGPQRPQEVRYFESLKRTAGRLGIDERVRFLGRWPDISRLLTSADIYCQPNVGPEGFGITLIEALHAGLPVVTSSIGPATEIVDDFCGVLVPSGDTAALSKALRRLIMSSTLRRDLGSQGPARAESLCAPATQVRKFHEMLARAIRDRAGREMPAGSAARVEISRSRDAAAS